jgi:hypothetical protein
MTFHGIVRQGKVELQPGTVLPDGTPVRIETLDADWRTEWESLARQVNEHWQSPRNALEVLTESRR